MEPNPHPLANFSNLKTAWDNLSMNIDWQVPRELFGSVGSKRILCYSEVGLGLV
jgi:hypothetical protein